MAEAADQQEPPEETLGTDGGEEIVRVYQNGVEVRNRRRYEGFRLTRTLSSTGDGSWVLNVSGHRAGRISRVLYGFVVNIDTTVSRRSGNELTIRDDNLKVVIEFRDPGSTNRVARQLEWQVLQQRVVADSDDSFESNVSIDALAEQGSPNVPGPDESNGNGTEEEDTSPGDLATNSPERKKLRTSSPPPPPPA